MASPSERTIKRLFALSGNVCAFPGCQLPIVESSGTVTGEICHICAQSPDGPRYNPKQDAEENNSFDNLLLLCRRHHKVIDSEPDVYSVDALKEIKSIHENVAGRAETTEDLFFAKILINDHKRISISNNTGNVAINSPGSVQGHTVNVTARKEKVQVSAPPGTIGADQKWTRYIQHLIKRYNEFASSDKTRKTKFHYGAISTNIEFQFGSPWRLLPIEKARDVSIYLQGRIMKTRQARINKGRGYKAFSTFEEFVEKHAR